MMIVVPRSRPEMTYQGHLITARNNMITSQKNTEEHRGPRFKKSAWYITASVALLVAIGGLGGGVVALVSRGGTSSASNDGTGSGADEMCQLDREALANCENGGLVIVPECAADAYQELTDTHSELLFVGAPVPVGCTAAHQGLVALAVFSQTNHGEDVADLICFLVMSTLYFALKGTQWRFDTSWLKGPSPCSHDDWYGVECSEDGSSISVSLDNNRLQGFLPTELGLLSNLRELGIGLNQISGSLPSEIGLLVQLQTIDFKLTSIDSVLPSEIGMLKELRELRSDKLLLTGSIPSEIGNMLNLEKLRLVGNALTGTLPTELGNLSHLEELHLRDLYI